jgi:hypothetical protein
MKMFLIALALVLSATAFARAGAVKIYVTLDGKPLPEASIVQIDAKGKAQSTRADSRGEATFEVADPKAHYCWYSKYHVHIQYAPGKRGVHTAEAEACHGPVPPVVRLNLH